MDLLKHEEKEALNIAIKTVEDEITKKHDLVLRNTITAQHDTAYNFMIEIDRLNDLKSYLEIRKIQLYDKTEKKKERYYGLEYAKSNGERKKLYFNNYDDAANLIKELVVDELCNYIELFDLEVKRLSMYTYQR